MPIGDNGTDLTNLQQARTNLIQQLRDLTRNPAIDYSLDGQAVSKTTYMRHLMDQIDSLNHLIEIEGGPVELVTIAYPGGFGAMGGGFG